MLKDQERLRQLEAFSPGGMETYNTIDPKLVEYKSNEHLSPE